MSVRPEIIVLKPSFYENGTLIKIIDRYGVDVFVQVNDEMFRLTGHSNSIFAANKAAGLNITQENAAEYLMFFCGHLAGDCGIFKIVTDPVLVEAKASSFVFTAMMNYAGEIFDTVIEVYRDGRTDMLEDERLGAVN